MKIKDVITKNNWCQNALAINSNGYKVKTSSPNACKFCALGWVYKVYGGDAQLYDEAIKKINHYTQLESIAKFNDNNDFEVIQKMFIELDI